MKGLIDEINQIPEVAEKCLAENKDLTLPQENTFYIGMGSSYYAPLTLSYAGADIRPEIASEYFLYRDSDVQKHGVLVSQSGESSETVWCLDKFEEVTSIVNNQDSTLAVSSKAKTVINIHAGNEEFSSTKTYINSLITLYVGLGFDPTEAVQKLSDSFFELRESGEKAANQIHSYMKNTKTNGLYILGSGPNLGTAYEGALTLSETTKLPWTGMSVAQFDHGPKETADDSVVIILNSNGKDQKRIELLKEVLERSSTLIIELNEEDLDEMYSPITLITILNFIMNFLADELHVGDTFQLGGKVTQVDL